jgi:hypothetical protein
MRLFRKYRETEVWVLFDRLGSGWHFDLKYGMLSVFPSELAARQFAAELKKNPPAPTGLQEEVPTDFEPKKASIRIDSKEPLYRD